MLDSNLIQPFIIDLLIVIGTLLLLSLSEAFNKETKNAYKDRYGQDSWNLVLTSSLIIGALSGGISAYGTLISSNGYLAPYLANYGTIIGYVGAQAMFTDFSLHKVDRYLLRIGYLDIFALVILFLTTTYNGGVLTHFLLPVILVYFVLIVMFIFSDMGASDVRALLIVVPFYQAVNSSLSIIFLLVITVLTFIFMKVQKTRFNDENYKVPILPVLVVPYIFITPFLEFAIEWWKTGGI